MNIHKFVKRLLPPVLHTPEMVAWLEALLSPLSDLYIMLPEYRQQILEYTIINITTDTLRYYLRLRYPAVNGYRCHIGTIYDDKPTNYTKIIGEHHAADDYDFFINEVQPDEYEFFIAERLIKNQYIIIVPTYYTGQALEIGHFISNYRPAGKQYILDFQDIP